ncbi:LEA type 2 family protein [Crocinitomicaceae bacterium]|nr:LEA type 2 family protein [Crocinitomicaceae bacterium]
MQKYIFFIVIVLMSSCEHYKEIHVTSLENVKIRSIEGKKIELELTVKANNPNFYGVKLKQLEGEMFAQNNLIGKVELVDPTKIKRKSENTYSIPVRLQLENGVLFRFVQLALRKHVDVQIKGVAKGSVFLISKTETFEFSKSIDGKFFNIQSLLNK